MIHIPTQCAPRPVRTRKGALRGTAIISSEPVLTDDDLMPVRNVLAVNLSVGVSNHSQHVKVYVGSRSEVTAGELARRDLSGRHKLRSVSGGHCVSRLRISRLKEIFLSQVTMKDRA